MILSPCKTCPRVNLPKDDCYKNCERLQTIQNWQLSNNDGPVETRVDYLDCGQLSVNQTAAKWLPPW